MSEQQPKPKVIDHTLRVRYAETDAMGIVHHASYLVYLEEARTNYIRALGSSYAEFERSGYYLAVSEVNVRYGQAARYDDLLRIACWVAQTRSRGMTFAYEIYHAETAEKLITATTKHICIDTDGKIARIPSTWQIEPETE